MIVCLVPLGSYHGSLACNNKTTNEDIRNKYAKYGNNVFDQGGCKKNCTAFCFGGESRILTQQEYKDELISLKEPNVYPVHAYANMSPKVSVP
jgi:hypothetical protein